MKQSEYYMTRLKAEEKIHYIEVEKNPVFEVVDIENYAVDETEFYIAQESERLEYIKIILKRRQLPFEDNGETPPALSDLIRQRMKETGVNASELALRINTTRVSIHRYLHGRIPRADILYKIARALNTDLGYFEPGLANTSTESEGE